MNRLFFLSLFLLISLSAIGQLTALQLRDTNLMSSEGIAVSAQMGSFQVPENRNNPGSRKIRLRFVRLKSTNPNPRPPLVYLEGGPGSACTWQAENPAFLERWRQYLSVCDVILLDQRGTGENGQESLFIWMKEIPEEVFVKQSVARTHFRAIAREALQAYQERGIDLSAYTSKENAADIEDLRKSLALDKISLLGFSYGTHLGQTYLRYFGQNVEKAILVGTEGSNHTWKLPQSLDTQLKRLSLMAKSDPLLKQDVPDLLKLYQGVVAKLARKPMEVSITSPLTREKIKVKVGPIGLQMILRIDIGDASDLPVFPRLLYSIDQGDPSILQWFVQKRYSNVLGTQGMAVTMDLASGASRARRLAIQQQENNSLFPGMTNLGMEMIEDIWPVPDLGEDFRSPLICDIPTLFMSGSLDFNTPPYQAEEVRWGFARSSHIIVEQAGHEQILAHPESVPTILRFLKGERLDTAILSFPELQFIPVKGKPGKLSHPSLEEN
ncbi:MAG: alpha/beta hydrolase [Bacteroidota bacterium]